MNWEISTHRNIAWPDLEARERDLAERVHRNPELAYCLISEPHPTFTYGLSAKPAELLWSQSDLREKEVGVFSARRGGKWTYHGPGQVVVYPIFALEQMGWSRRGALPLLNTLQSICAEVLSKLGVDCRISRKPLGIYAAAGKIASFGVQIDRGVTSHGFAVYLSRQSHYFSGIHPCGTPLTPITSLEERGVAVEWTELAELLALSVKKGFQR